jgi:magnesium-transporting ATPase (P-type)
MPTDLPRPKRPPRNQHPQGLRWRILWEAIIAIAVAIAITAIIASLKFAFS